MKLYEAPWRHSRDAHGSSLSLNAAQSWLPFIFYTATCARCGVGPFILREPPGGMEGLLWALGHEATHTAIFAVDPTARHWSDCREGMP